MEVSGSLEVHIQILAVVCLGGSNKCAIPIQRAFKVHFLILIFFADCFLFFALDVDFGSAP